MPWEQNGSFGPMKLGNCSRSSNLSSTDASSTNTERQGRSEQAGRGTASVAGGFLKEVVVHLAVGLGAFCSALPESVQPQRGLQRWLGGKGREGGSKI